MAVQYNIVYKSPREEASDEDPMMKFLSRHGYHPARELLDDCLSGTLVVDRELEGPMWDTISTAPEVKTITKVR